MVDPLLNLIYDRWIPVSGTDNEIIRVAPWELFDQSRCDANVILATPRPDFQGSVIQFLIGLVQSTIPPINEEAWVKGLQSLPSSGQVKSGFESVSSAFNLGGEGYRFMQDPACADGKKQAIDTLVIGMPGENTLKMNSDLFLKRDTIQQICPSCAAMTLMTLQMNGPPGGAGHRTGLRGGGPLSTVVLGKSLRETIWLNVLPEDELYLGSPGDRKSSYPDIFPWMGPLRTSEAGTKTGISDVSQLQQFWGMGRRILLDIDQTKEGTCDMCGLSTKTALTSFQTKPYGINYDESWRHVLTPYYQSGDDHFPVHVQSEGITYRHWLGLVQNDPEDGREIARVVQRFRNIQADLSGLLPPTPQLWAFGYDLDNVKARCWYDSYMPLVRVSDRIREEYEISIAQIVRAARYVNDTLHGCVKDALYKSERNDVSKSQKNTKNISIVKSRFWSETEPLFYSTLTGLMEKSENGESVDPVKRQWIAEARKTALDLFDFYSQTQYVDEYRPKAITGARKRLAMTVSPGAPKIMKILSLKKEA